MLILSYTVATMAALAYLVVLILVITKSTSILK